MHSDSSPHHFAHPDEWLKKPLNGTLLTAAQRQYGFVQFWTEVKYNFAYFDQVPELDWDAILYEYLPIFQQDQSNESYYRTLQFICAKLKDGHTNIYPPRFPESPKDEPAIQVLNITRRAYVINTTSLYAEQIPLGSEIIAVDGIPTSDYLSEKIFPYLSTSTEHIRYHWGIDDILKGPKGTDVVLTVKKPNGQTGHETVTRDRRAGGRDWLRKAKSWKLFDFQQLPSGIGYVVLGGFHDKEVVSKFEAHLEDLRKCTGIIIDLRRNGGGSSIMGYDILKHFTDQPFNGSASRTRDHRAAHKAWGQYLSDKPMEELDEFDRISRLTLTGEYWHEFELMTYSPSDSAKIKAPMVVLIGPNTASAAEDFLVALDQIGIATLIGQPTCGSTGQPLMMDLPGGGRARICTKKDTYPDGREFVGYGIQPDIYIEANISDILSEKDVVLEAGIKQLTGK